VPLPICVTCGIQYAGPVERRVICEDARQYVGWAGQRWTTLEELRTVHHADVRDDHGLLGIGCEPSFAIGQRAPVAGGVLCDCVPLPDGTAEAAGGVRAIAISHPHYFTTMVDRSRALGGVPVDVHEDDREWVVDGDGEERVRASAERCVRALQSSPSQ
jgi:hypothetical protein